MVHSDRSNVRRSGFTNTYHNPSPNLIHHVSGRFRRLPIVTGSCAHGANSIGVFGLVWPSLTNTYHSAHARPLVDLDWSTNCYHRADLGRNRPSICFTNHRRRIEGRGIIDCEACYFGKEFLRMAGIVQMLHILQPPYGRHSK